MFDISVCFTRVALKNYQHGERLRALLELRFRAERCYLAMSQLAVVFMRVTSNLAGFIDYSKLNQNIKKIISV